jgi:phage host-nuclease inhibitor protein Gam
VGVREVIIVCPHCKKKAQKPNGAVTRAAKVGMPIYCDRVCAGFARRVEKTIAQKKEEKRLYDLQYRAARLETIKANKRAYFQRTYDPKKAAIERKERMPKHVEYCRRPEYRDYKAQYDRQLRAQVYGEFAEAFLLLGDLDREVNNRMTDYDIRVMNGTLNKRLQRKREYENTIRR